MLLIPGTDGGHWLQYTIQCYTCSHVTLLPTAHSAQSSGEIANFLICHCHWRYLQPAAAAGHVAPATRQNNYLYPPTHTFIHSHLPLYTLARSARGPTVETGHKTIREKLPVSAAGLHVSTPGMYVAMWALSGFPEECALVVRCVKKTNFREQKAGCNWSPNLPRCH